MASPTLDQLSALLSDAQTAYHALLTGKAIASVRDQNGEEVRYTQATRPELAAYVSDLQAQVAALSPGYCPASLGPMRLFF